MPRSIHIIVGSTNPVKVRAAKNAFLAFFPDDKIQCDGVSVPSGVSDQPMTEAETRRGAQNRANYCAREYHQTADYFVSMEGGVDQFEEGAATFAYVAIIDNTHNKLMTGRSANLPLPNKVFTRLKNGEELGLVMDDLFNTSNIRQKGGAIGLLTNHNATRESIYTQALVLAFAPSLHPEHYS